MENERGSKEWFRVSAKEYREFADECMGWAKTARSNQERQIFTQMAQTWLWAAARTRRRYWFSISRICEA